MAEDFLSVMKVLPDPVGSFMQGRQQAADLAATQSNTQVQQYQLQQAQQQQQAQAQQQAAYQQAVAGFIQNPTAEGAANLSLQFPNQQKAITDAWNMRDAAVNAADRQQLANVFSLLNNGYTDQAQKLLEQRQLADQQAGKSEPMVDRLLQAIKTNPDHAKGVAAYALASIPGGEDFAKVLDKVGTGDDGSVVVNEGGALVKKSTGEVLYQAAKSPHYQVVKNADGSESVVALPEGTAAAGAVGGSPGATPSGQRYSGGWTPRARNGGDNLDNVVDNKITGAARFLGVDPTADISGLSPAKIAQAMTLSEGGAGSLADRNNNPGNLRNPDGSYKSFPSKQAGLAAAAALVARKLKAGQTTVQSLIEGLPVGGTQAARPAGASVVFTSEGGDPSSGLDQSDIAYYAQQVLAGAPMPTLGMGKAAVAAKTAIMHEVARQAGAEGLTGADLARQIAHYKAGSAQIKNLEVMAGNVSQAEQTALANGQQFLDRSAEIPGQTPFMALNGIIQSVARHTGNADIAAHDAALNTFVNEYAKVVAGSPSGAGTLSDSARHEAQSIMQGNYSLAQKQRAFAQMKADMANRIAAIHNGINDAYGHLTSKPGYAVPQSTAELGGGRQAAPRQQGGAPAGATRAVRNPQTGQTAYLVNGKWIVR